MGHGFSWIKRILLGRRSRNQTREQKLAHSISENPSHPRSSAGYSASR